MKLASRIVAIVACAVMIALMSGCSIPGLGGGVKPTLTIVAPPDDAQVQVGQEAIIKSISTHSEGVSRVDLTVDEALLRSDASADPQGEPTLTVDQGWTPDTVGVHTIVVQAFSSGGEASDPVSITLNAVAAEETPTPSPTPTTEAEDEAEDEEEDNCDDAAYVADITVPDGTTFAPGASFAKTWRIKNTGTCDWDAGYQLAFVGGDQLGAASGVNVVATPAGAEVDVTVNMFATAEGGTFTGRWQVRNPDGEFIGETLTVVIKVEGVATATPTSTTTPSDEVKIEFGADSDTITQGECTFLRWEVENALEVYYQEGGVAGEGGERRECPSLTNTYKLRVVHAGGETTEEQTITVQPPGGTEDEFSNFQVTEQTSDSIRIRVDYNYVSDHGDPLTVSAYAYGSGAKLAAFGFVPGTADAGSGTTEVELTYHGAGSETSDQIELRMLEQDGDIFGPGFYSKRLLYTRTWGVEGGDSLSNFHVEEISDQKIRVTVDYTYGSAHGEPIEIDAFALGGGERKLYFAGGHYETNHGNGTATIDLTYGYGGAPATFASDQIEIVMAEPGTMPSGSGFLSATYNFAKHWVK